MMRIAALEKEMEHARMGTYILKAKSVGQVHLRPYVRNHPSFKKVDIGREI